MEEATFVEKIPTRDFVLKNAKEKFRSIFSEEAEYASFAPGRVNLIGEHTDYNDGYVFPMALPLITVIIGKKNNLQRIRLKSFATGIDTPSYVELEAGVELTIGNPKWLNYIKGVIAYFKGQVHQGWDAVIVSSVPVGSGLSSSAALEVATFTFLENIFGVHYSTEEKVLACQKAEHNFAGVPCGVMDQFISAAGCENKALLIDCRSVHAQAFEMPGSETELVILIANSNVQHSLAGSEYAARRAQCMEACKIMQLQALRDASLNLLEKYENVISKTVYKRARHVINEIERTKEASVCLESANYIRFGELMTDSHSSLRDDYEVSCQELDILVVSALSVAGVLGSRMTGGGFGGCTVTLLKKESVTIAVKKMKEAFQRNGFKQPSFYCVTASPGAGPLCVA